MKLLACLNLIFSYRLLKLKLYEDRDLFVTTLNGLLKLLPPTDKYIRYQRIVVHKRKLFFNIGGQSCSLTMENDNLEVKVDCEKKVAYLRRIGGGREADPFGFGNSTTKKPKRETSEDNKETVKSSKSTSDTDTGSENIKNSSRIQKQSAPRRQTTVRIENTRNDDTRKNEDIPRRRETDNQQSENNGNIDMDSILSKVKHLLTEKKDYLVESDSKIEEESVKYKNIDIFIYPIDRKYIKLKTKEKDCVTYFNGTFIITPCLNVENQIFRIEKEDDVIKNMKEYGSEEIEEDTSNNNEDEYERSSLREYDESTHTNRKLKRKKKAKRYIKEVFDTKDRKINKKKKRPVIIPESSDLTEGYSQIEKPKQKKRSEMVETIEPENMNLYDPKEEDSENSSIKEFRKKKYKKYSTTDERKEIIPRKKSSTGRSIDYNDLPLAKKTFNSRKQASPEEDIYNPENIFKKNNPPSQPKISNYTSQYPPPMPKPPLSPPIKPVKGSLSKTQTKQFTMPSNTLDELNETGALDKSLSPDDFLEKIRIGLDTPDLDGLLN